jgi:hypothetical protein
LEGLPKALHERYHAGLDKILPRQKGGEYYEQLPPFERQQMLKDFEAFTKAFDANNGTNLWEAALRNGFPGP